MAIEKRIPRVRIHEDNFSDEIKNPSYPKECIDNYKRQPKDYFIEVVNTKDEVIALFFIVDGNDYYYSRNLLESEELDSFVADFDMWLTPNYQWEDIENLR
jgi:hypothetical protein